MTHGMVGAAAASLLPRRLRRPAVVVALMVVAILPDLDVLAFSLDIPYEHPLGHRGFTHSLMFAAVAGLCVAWLLGGASWRSRWSLAAVAAAATASHGVLDAMTTGGLGVGFFVPWSDARYFFALRPIPVASVDPSDFLSARGAAILTQEVLWIWLPVIGLVASLAWLRRRWAR